MMRIKTILYLLITLSSLMLFSCNKNSDKYALNERINEFVNIIEKHDEQDMRNYLAEDFSVVKRFNKVNFFLFVRYHLKRNKNISINLINKEIKLHESYADVTANVLLLGADKWLPERGQRYYVESRWKIKSGDWVMSHLRWTVK